VNHASRGDTSDFFNSLLGFAAHSYGGLLQLHMPAMQYHDARDMGNILDACFGRTRQ
jgi:hypothetical protein